MRLPATVSVTPVRWRPPTGPYLRGEGYPRGRPPFDPYPTVLQIVKGYCPVAIHLHQLWGRTWEGRIDTGLTDPIGPLYHELVAEFRMRLAWRAEPWNVDWDRTTCRARLYDYYSRWADRKVPNATLRRRLWERFSVLMERKHSEGDLREIIGSRILAEVDLVNPRCPFTFGSSRHHYPIRGRIDEINLDRGIIIERSLERDPLTQEPPVYKHFQAWLCGWAVRTLEDHLRAAPLDRLWNGALRIQLETPERDYDISLDDTRFLPWIAQAYYWIQALYRNRGQAASAAYQNAACTIDQPDDSCMHCRIDCFTRRPAFPRQRQEIGRLCSQFARALLYDRVWDEDLWYYRQAMLPEEYHTREGTRVVLPIIDVNRDEVRAEITGPRERLRENQTVLALASPTGNMTIGKRWRLLVTRIAGNVMTLRAVGQPSKTATSEV